MARGGIKTTGGRKAGKRFCSSANLIRFAQWWSSTAETVLIADVGNASADRESLMRGSFERGTGGGGGDCQ